MKTMKNRLGKILAVTAIAVSLLATSFAFANDAAPAKSAAGTVQVASTSVISWSKGMSIFRKELPANAVIKYLRLTRDDGVKMYKGKAVKGSYVYSIEMEAYTGEVLESDRDYEGSRYSASRVGAVSKTSIKSKIWRRVPDATIVYVKLTRDDGRYVYEAEAYKNGYEYEFEYSKRGTLLDSERDKV